MVIYCAVGGRMSLMGAVYGCLLVNFGRTIFSESFPALWLFLMGGVFILVTMVFPDGLAGIIKKYGVTWWAYIKKPFDKGEGDQQPPASEVSS